MQENDIGNNLGPRIGLECILRQTDGSQQFGTLGQIPTHGGILGIHRVTAGDKGHHAAGTHLVDGLGEEIVMDGKAQLVVGFVVDLIIPEGYVAHGQVEEVAPVGGFKPRHGDVRFRVELPGDAAGEAVQLHAIQAAARHALRQ